MKFLIVLAALVALSAGQLRGFGRAQASAFSRPAAAAPRFPSAPAAPRFAAAQAASRFAAPAAPAAPARVSSGDQGASILKSESDINPDGTYIYAYETDNGISAQVQGSANAATGSFSWTSVEGQPIAISFVADENGYQPSGDALPTPPPIPPQIARALEWLAVNARPQE